MHFSEVGKEDVFFFVHGDTLSTVMGARLARALGIPFGHIEAGYRSFNFLCPFPEEFDRYYSSLFSVINFAPGEGPSFNLRTNKGLTVNTGLNTVIETLDIARKHGEESPLVASLSKPFFLFIFHRQENLLDVEMCKKVVANILKLSEKMECVFIFHAYTRNCFESYGLFSAIKEAKNVRCISRVPYFEFINIVSKSEFVVTDGAGNQQEMYYLGKPCLLLRRKVEGKEGLGGSTRLCSDDLDDILSFFEEYKGMIRDPVKAEVPPSKIILDATMEYLST
jgi:UDP-N-acetylglucosamine 2-epimerase (non-hydrolysing)